MRKVNRILLILAAILLVPPSFFGNVSAKDSYGKIDPEQIGEISSKDEVVYATLSATGNEKEIYVVNTFDVKKEGHIVDYGSYSSLKNLTNLSEIKQVDHQVQFTASEGKFYYQGNMSQKPLPWNIVISYLLDGKEMSPDELAGKDGHVSIRIETYAHKEVNPVFFENYLLQISLPLDSDIFTNIQAHDGMIANAGKNKLVTFTVMPGQEKNFVVEADAVDFELAGIDITGIPSLMAIDSPDVDEMKDDMKTLSDAIGKVNDGVGELKSGVSTLNRGVMELQDGSKQYKNGMTKLGGSSSELISGSNEIKKALETMDLSLGNIEGMDLSGIGQLTEGLKGISIGLGETASGLTTLKQNYEQVFGTLDKAMANIPSYNITDEELAALQSSDANQEVVGKLLETYGASRVAKGTYDEVKQGFQAVDGTLQGVIDGLTDMEHQLDTMGDQLFASLKEMDGTGGFEQLQEGIAALSSQYKTFHSGLVDYTNGVGQLSHSYQDLHEGIVKFSGGTKELENGVVELHDGTIELNESTSDLPDQLTAEIDQMIAEYDKSDIDLVSFVAAENEKVDSVQFILKTESIKAEKPETTTEKPVEIKKGFWARLIDLFK